MLSKDLTKDIKLRLQSIKGQIDVHGIYIWSTKLCGQSGVGLCDDLSCISVSLHKPTTFFRNTKVLY